MNEVIDFENLYTSAHKCCKGVMWKESAAAFMLNDLEKTLKLEAELQSGKYKAKKPYGFIISTPKKREIVSICFKDRVYQRCLNDIAVYPDMAKSFIYDNAACQKGKGTDFARGRLKEFLRRAYRKYGTNFHVLQCDIHGYYPNMRHDVAKAVFKKHLDAETYRRCAEVLDGQYQGNIGYNPGSQMIQIAGISVLNDMDHFIKERLRIQHYIRYMDDFLLIHKDAGYLKHCKEAIQNQLTAIGFEFNTKKTRMYPVADKISFLGFVFTLTSTGKIYMTLDSSSTRRERKKLRRMVALCRRGKITKSKVYTCYASWKAHASKGNSHKLLTRMDQFLKNLFMECDDNGSETQC